VYSFLLNGEIKEETLLPCYFFHGEETFLAFEFASSLQKTLIPAEVQDLNLERFDVEESSWAEIIDLARTIPFFLSPWRIVVVEISKGRKESLSSEEQKILKAYFSSPSPKTVLVIIFFGRLGKNSSLYRFFSGLPSSTALVRELRPLKEKALYAWIDRRFLSHRKRVTSDASMRLEELTGKDLRRVNNEIEKLVTFVGEKEVVDLDDVNQVSGWIKSFHDWEIADSLAKADIKQSLVVLNSLFKEGTRPEYVLGSISRFFRDIFLAKILLREKNVDKKEVFKELKPQIHERLGKFYLDKFKEFFSLVERFSMQDLNHILAELEEVDLKIKTTPLSSQTLLESFIFRYCDLRKKERIT
jgi:DNA polymerase III delta subunit